MNYKLPRFSICLKKQKTKKKLILSNPNSTLNSNSKTNEFLNIKIIHTLEKKCDLYTLQVLEKKIVF